MPDLDPEGFTTEEGASSPGWQSLWEFALTFDGYRYFGDDEGAPERLGRFADSVRAAHRQDGQLPRLDLAQLRACLFYEQRRWCKHSTETHCPPDVALYLEAVLRAIRAHIT